MHTETPHLFFDLDHTLWDFQRCANEALGEIFVQFRLAHHRDSLTVAEFCAMFHRVNDALWADYHRKQLDQATLRQLRFERIMAMLGIGLPTEEVHQISEYYLYHAPRKPYLLPHTAEVLAGLHQQGYPLHIISNGFPEVVYVKLENTHIQHFFTHVIHPGNAQSQKPDKKIFEYALAQARITPAQALMIGDNWATDVEGALGVGIKAIYYRPAGGKPRRAPEVQVIRDLRGLQKVLTKALSNQ